MYLLNLERNCLDVGNCMNFDFFIYFHDYHLGNAIIASNYLLPKEVCKSIVREMNEMSAAGRRKRSKRPKSSRNGSYGRTKFIVPKWRGLVLIWRTSPDLTKGEQPWPKVKRKWSAIPTTDYWVCFTGLPTITILL